MAYKSLTDRVRWGALVPFLNAASTLAGTIVIFLIDRQIRTLFSDPGDLRLLPELVVATRGWKVKSFRRLLLVASLGGLIVSCLSADEQDILWLTDEDEIAANPKKHNDAGHVISYCIERYSPQHRGTFVFLTTEGKHDECFREDVVAIPDLAAGALVEAFSTIDDFKPSQNGPACTLPSSLPTKANAVLRWLADDDKPLRNVVVSFDVVGDDVDVGVFQLAHGSGQTLILR